MDSSRYSSPWLKNTSLGDAGQPEGDHFFTTIDNFLTAISNPWQVYRTVKNLRQRILRRLLEPNTGWLVCSVLRRGDDNDVISLPNQVIAETRHSWI